MTAQLILAFEFIATALALYCLYRLIVAERQAQILPGYWKANSGIKRSLLNQEVKPRIFRHA